MLNELSLVVDAIERMGATPTSRHPRINPMGKNKTLLIIGINLDGAPASVEFLAGEVAGELFRVEHGSAGSSFPGFNLPVPLRDISAAPPEALGSALEKLIEIAKNKNTDAAAHHAAIAELCALSLLRKFTSSQEKQFQRSCADTVTELHALLAPTAPAALRNFVSLLEILQKNPPSLADFSRQLADLLVLPGISPNRGELTLVQGILFGALDWKKRSGKPGAPEYWKEKAKQDKTANQPVYLDLAFPDTTAKRVAHSATSALLNATLVAAQNANQPADVSTEAAVTEPGESEKNACTLDAFSGKPAPLQEKYPSPKIAELGNVMLFSVNSKEVAALKRYKLGGAATFPAAASRVQKMNDALLFLASEERRGTTCTPIPGPQSGKRDLLVAYLENDSGQDAGASGQATSPAPGVAEMFGCETTAFSDADFAERTKTVLKLFSAKLDANPDLRVRLFALCAVDKGRKQASLNRTYRVGDIRDASTAWNIGAANIPRITVWSWDKEAKRSLFHAPRVPSPIDLVTTVNRVWSTDPKLGFAYTHQRALSTADAYDIFIPDSPQIAGQKTRLALYLLVTRMAAVLARLGAVKISHQEKDLSDTVRLQSLKTISLLGLLLHKLNQPCTAFMKEPVYQLGQMLALADALHQQYCKHVRDGQMPAQLIGNALFNTALEQPVFALARLGERLAPYQAWAKTFHPSDPEQKFGWEKKLLSKLCECSHRFIEDINGILRIRTDELPARMTDEDKAKLLLGYLADIHDPKKTTDEHTKSEN